MTTAHSSRDIPGAWIGVSRPLHLSTAGPGYIYLGVKRNYYPESGLTRVNLDVFLTELADFLGKRITVSEVETVVTVKSERVYGV